MDLLIFQVPILMVQASLDGILLGILFALIAYGMALQWGVMNIINIAQGDLVILGGYITYFMYLSGIHPALGVIVAPAIMYFIGVGLYKLVINKVVDRDLFISILATFGISILFMQLMNFAFGADVVLANSDFGTTMLFNNSVTLPNSKIFAAVISIIFAIGLVFYMKKSKLGRAIRATAQNARAAKILGVDTEKVYAATFGINAALCGVAGSLVATALTVHESLVPAAVCGTVTITSQVDEESYATVTAGHSANQSFTLDAVTVKVSSKLPLLSMSKVIVRTPGARFILEAVVKVKELVLVTSI